MTTVKLDTIQEKKPREASDEWSQEQALLDAEAESAQHRTALHGWVSWFIPVAVKWWLIALLLLLLADSMSLTLTWHDEFRIQSFDFDIDTYVMVALVGSTSLAVGGLVNYALKSLLGKTHE